MSLANKSGQIDLRHLREEDRDIIDLILDSHVAQNLVSKLNDRGNNYKLHIISMGAIIALMRQIAKTNSRKHSKV